MIKNGMSLFVLLLPSFLFSAITKGPYLIKPSQNSMTVMWESDTDEMAKVIYWQSGVKENTVERSSFVNQTNYFLYSAELKGLKPNQKYYYKVVMEKDSSNESYFYSAPSEDNEYRFVAMGDSRSGHDTFADLAEAIQKEEPRMIISMGDLVYSGKEFDEWETHYFTPAKSMINHIPVISTVGDHEIMYGYNGYNFFYYFQNGVRADKQWFSYDYGSTHYVSLDFRGEFNQEMIDWFKKDMSQSDAKWKIVYLHRPTYNLGGHRTNWGNQVWQKLYSDYSVDIVFAGHSHIYERFYPLIPKGSKDEWAVTYITTGGAGAGLYDVVQNDFTAVTKSTNHYMIIDVSQSKLDVIVKELDGNIIDKFEIAKNDGKQSESYLSLVQPETPLNIYMAFSHNLNLRIRKDLTGKKFFIEDIFFESKSLGADVPFEIRLTKESSKYYQMDLLKGVLKNNERYDGEIKIYPKEKFINKGKFFEPKLFLELVYKYDGKEYLSPGAECRYYKPKENLK